MAPQVNINKIPPEESQQLLSLTEKLKKSGGLYVAIAGGVGAFGTNLTIFQSGATTVWIDIGAGFSNRHTPGLLRSIPNQKLISELLPSIIILTHAHEDHVGAFVHLYYLIPERTPIYCSEFTFAILRQKLIGEGLDPSRFQFRFVESNSQVPGDDFNLHFFFMPHSIPQVFSVGLDNHKTRQKIYFTSDFKTKGSEKRFEKKDIEKFGPVEHLFCDSTGAITDGYSDEEASIGKNLQRAIEANPGRVFITTFSSQIERIRNLFAIANEQKRPIGILGASIRYHLKAAFEADEFHIPLHNLENPSPKNAAAIWIVAGCQADENSSFARLARGELGRFDLNNQDTLIYSGSMIPGNEDLIFETLNSFAEAGVKIIGLGKTDQPVHCSGHGRKQDILQLMNWVKPKNVIPVHGDAIHFNEFADICKQAASRPNLQIVNRESVYKIETRLISYAAIDSQLSFVEEKEIHDDINLFKRRRDLSRNGICNLVASNSPWQLRHIDYIGCCSAEFLNQMREELNREIHLLFTENNGLKQEKARRKVVEGVHKINKKILGKSPYVNLILLNQESEP